MPPKKILVVDDSATQRRYMELVLWNSGFSVLAANDGESASQIAQSEKIDLILLDIIMPGIDGFTVCRQLREDKKTQAIPIVLTSSSDARDHQLKAEQAGAAGFIRKDKVRQQLHRFLN